MKALVVFLVLLPVRGSAQARSQETRVGGAATCTTCVIRVRESAVIGNQGGVLSEWPQSMWQDTRGRIWVTQSNKAELPQVYDSLGRFLTALGSIGGGPGEFRRAAVVFGDSRDTIFIIDRANARLTVIDPLLRPVRSFLFPNNALSGAVLSDGNLAVNAIVHDRQTVGLPFQIFDRRGFRFAARGTKGRAFVPSNQHLFSYRIAPAANGGFWAFPLFGRYEVERWSRGDTVQVFRRDLPAWFTSAPEHLGRGRGPTGDPPMSWIVGGWEDREGLLWVIARIEDARPSRQADTVKGPEGPYVVPKSFDREYDSMVEVIDPRTGRIVVSQRFDEVFSFVLGRGTVASVRELGDGRLNLAIRRLQLTKGR